MRPFFAVLMLLLSACGGGVDERDVSTSTFEVPELPPRLSENGLQRGDLAPTREFRIAFTGALRGEVQPCGCPTLPYGGFARRQLYLDEVEAEGFPLFQLDAGEALLKGVSQYGRDDARRRAEAVLKMMGAVGVDVVTIGPTDVIAFATLNGLTHSSGSPQLLSGGWRNEEGGRLPPSQISVVLERGGVRLGVVGISADSQGPEIRDRFVRQEVESSVREGLQALPGNLDLVIVLGSLSNSEAVAVAEAFPDVGLILKTSESSEREAVWEHAGAVVVETPPRGRYVTTLRFRLASTPSQGLDTSGTEYAAFEALLERRAQALLLGSEGMTEEKTAALATAEESLERKAAGLNLVQIVDRPLGSRFKGQTPVDALLEDFLDELIVEAESVAAPVTEQAEERFGTPSACVSCHVQEFAQWAYTGHKQATATLVERGEHKNPECLSCHSTGFGEVGGFGEPTPFNLGRFGGVQCEACHGALAGHPEDEDIQPHPVDEQTCLTCHDEANSPEFNYEDYVRRIRCNRG